MRKVIKTTTKIVKVKEKPTCCVVENDKCLAPANVTEDAKIRIRTWCFSCGLYVCRDCSQIIQWYNFGDQRICNNCIGDYQKKQKQNKMTTKEELQIIIDTRPQRICMLLNTHLNTAKEMQKIISDYLNTTGD